MIVLAHFGGFLMLMLVAAMFYDRRARRRGLRPGVSERDVLMQHTTERRPLISRVDTDWVVAAR